jgi:dethiobiotin synthetase
MMGALFVTSTGTGIGKTFVTAALVKYFRAQGSVVDAFKPVLSGFDPGNVEDSDTGALLTALGRKLIQEEFDRISPWRFAAPLAPDMAAAREDRHIDFDALVDFSKAAMQSAETVLIEGVGGIMVPLDDKHTVLDWMRALDVPIVLIAGSYLGTISHTLSALEVLKHHRCDVRAIVVSESEESPVALGETVASIARFAKAIEVIALPRLERAQDHPAIGQIAAAIDS